MELHSFIGYQILIILSLRASLGHSAEMWLYCGSLTNYTSAELSNPLSLLYNTCFDETRKSVFYAFGLNATPEDEITQDLIESYITLGKHNVFLINWKEEASSELNILVPVLYPAKAVPNTLRVGEMCGEALDKMSDHTLDLSRTHGVGWSLGAHLLGYCGEKLQTVNKCLARITGLDPAGPIFDKLGTGLRPSNAHFVDVVHTDPNIFGSKKQRGHVDFWFNCQLRAQPNCANPFILKFLGAALCSHKDAVRYFAAAVLYPNALAAVASQSCYRWQTSALQIDTIIYVGEITDIGARGNFFLTTDIKYPFGKGLKGISPGS